MTCLNFVITKIQLEISMYSQVRPQLDDGSKPRIATRSFLYYICRYLDKRSVIYDVLGTRYSLGMPTQRTDDKVEPVTSLVNQS